MMMIMMNCFSGMVDRRKLISIIFSRNLYQRFSPSKISDVPGAGFKSLPKIKSNFVEWSWVVKLTLTPRHQTASLVTYNKEILIDNFIFCALTYKSRRWIYHNVQQPQFVITGCLQIQSNKFLQVNEINVFKNWYYSFTMHFLSVSIFHNNMPMFGGNLSRSFSVK